MGNPCSRLPNHLVTILVVFATGFVVEGVIFFLVIADLITSEHVVCFLLGMVVCAGITSWTLLWIKRMERLRNAKRKEYLLKDRPPVRQNRVHPFAFEPIRMVDMQPLTYKQLFEPDQLLKTLLPRRTVALCEVHQYNSGSESQSTESDSPKEPDPILQRSKSWPSLNDSCSGSLYTEERRRNTD